jgi:hypothetical protein
MSGSQNLSKDILFSLYQHPWTVFRLRDVAMLVGSTDFQSLNQKLNYYVRQKKLLNPRKGIYTKLAYNKEELACSVFSPCYISLDYVLQKNGVNFQYDSGITLSSYLSRSLEIDKQTYRFRRIKENILLDITGIIRNDNINIASTERAFLDLLYLEKEVYFDNLNVLDIEKIDRILPIYGSKALEKRVKKIL